MALDLLFLYFLSTVQDKQAVINQDKQTVPAGKKTALAVRNSLRRSGGLKMKANVYVTLKNGVLDPQGRAVMDALGSLDFKELKDLRIGRFIELEVDAANAEEARERVTEMCKSLLANPVIEDYRVEVRE